MGAGAAWRIPSTSSASSRRRCPSISGRAGRSRSAGRKAIGIFPQIEGLGLSPTSVRFAISSLEEASAYLAHPILGPRLRECARLALGVEGRTARDIFGSIDEMKFRSSVTLFARAAPSEGVFQRCLDKYFLGQPDPATLARL